MTRTEFAGRALGAVSVNAIRSRSTLRGRGTFRGRTQSDTSHYGGLSHPVNDFRSKRAVRLFCEVVHTILDFIECRHESLHIVVPGFKFGFCDVAVRVDHVDNVLDRH